MPRLFHNPLRRAPTAAARLRTHHSGDIVCHFPGSGARSRRTRRAQSAPPHDPKLKSLTVDEPAAGRRRRSRRRTTDAAPKKRRRGTRGGRNRKKRRPRRRRRGATAVAEKPAPQRAEGAGAQARTHAARARRTPPKRAPLPKAKRELAHLGRRGREARRRARGRQGRRGLPRAARAPLDRRQHLPRRRRQRPAGHGGRVRRDRPREERLPLRRRDRRPRARGPQGRPQDPGPDPARREDPRPGGQGPDEDEGRAAHDRDLAARPLRRLRPARRGARRLAPARGRRAQPAEGDPQGDRAEEGRRDRAHRRRGRVGRGRRARPRLPAAALEDDRGEGEGVEGAVARLPGGRAAAARRARPLHRRLRAPARRPRPHAQAHRRLPEEDLAAHGRARDALQGARAADGGVRRRAGDQARRSAAASTCPRAAT